MPTKGSTRPKVPCPQCGKEVGSVASHMPYCSSAAPIESTAVAVAERSEPRSERGRARFREDILRPIDQIPIPPGSGSIQATGAWAYYLRPDGATISDALVLYPNGGVPDLDDPRMAARYGENHLYYRERQAQKGLEYIGQVLTEGGVERLVELLAQNRQDEILFCEDEIESCMATANSSDRPEIRDQAKKRKRQFEKRLAYLKQPLEPEALVAELKEIARAQQLSKVDPNVLRVMRSMIGEVNANMAEAIGKFQAGKAAPDGAPRSLNRQGADETIFDSTGKSRID